LVEYSISRKNDIYVRRPALELLCISLCGPRTKRFGDPWYRLWRVVATAHILVGVQHPRSAP